jgi:hypothetical protein
MQELHNASLLKKFGTAERRATRVVIPLFLIFTKLYLHVIARIKCTADGIGMVEIALL